MAFSGRFLPALAMVMFAMTTTDCQAAKILCVSHQFGSHQRMVHSAAEGLIEHGHEVYTVFSDRMHVPKGLEEKGFKILRYHTPKDSNIMTTDANAKETLDTILSGSNLGFSVLKFISKIAAGECIDMDNDVAFIKTITDLKFDLAMIDVFPLANCLTFVGLKFNIPFVLVPHLVEIEMIRSPVLPSFFPNEFSLLTDEMTFTERLVNVYYTLIVNVPSFSNSFPGRQDTRLLRKYSTDSEMTTWYELTRKAELFLISRAYMLDYPGPFMPNVINIECLTCKPGKQLPADIESLINGSEGVVVVSFGSLIDDFPDDLASKFIKAFGEMKELVFWRFNGKYPGHIPDNVKLMKWLPQNDLLAHPKTKLFITHSGNNGQYESVYHGVPLLAFPVFAEQPYNAVRIVKHGYGLKADIRLFTTQELLGKMREIIENPLYREKTQRASRILKSRPMNAQQTATYWIEHILEFGGDHLRSHGLKMPWYSFYMIDILLFLEALVIGVTCAAICACFWLSKRLCGGKAKQKRE